MNRLKMGLLILLMPALSAFAQAPEKMTYQAVIRNNSNALVTNSNIGIKVSILQGGVTGTPVFVETHSTTTNVNGLITIEIGSGSALSGAFSSINWVNGTYFLKTETDPSGGNNYSLISTSQLLSVPYSFYAKSSNDGKNAKTLIYSGF